MTLAVTPHLNFRGQARAALAFYHAALGGEVALVTFRDAGMPVPEAALDHVMWGEVAAPSGARVMAYDVAPHLPYEPGANSFYVSLRGTEAGEVSEVWERLSDGAEVVQPLGPAAWSAFYGMLRDRFGVTWVLDVAA